MSVHQMVNHIARVVGRPAVLEDQRQRVVAYSPQSGVIDEVRRKTILQHHAGPAVSSWLSRLGVYSAKESTRVPQNSELGMLPRLCVPIRRSEKAMGYLWFIDAPDEMAPADVARADDLATRLAEEWTRSRAQHDLELALIAEHTRELLLGGAGARGRAAEVLIGEGLFPDGTPVRVLQLRARRGRRSSAEPRGALERAVRRAVRTAPLGGALHLVKGDRALVVVPEPADRPAEPERAAETLLAAAGGVDGAYGIGVGSVRSTLAAARASMVEAERAVRIADAFRLPARIVHWDLLGVYRGLDRLAANGLAAADFQHGLERLLAERDGEALLETAECYLNLGGRAQEAAARLNVHRTSLYHRLGRVERILGIDLQNGVERLGLHLAILLRNVETEFGDADASPESSR